MTTRNHRSGGCLIYLVLYAFAGAVAAVAVLVHYVRGVG
jgi:hypothetical protein